MLGSLRRHGLGVEPCGAKHPTFGTSCHHAPKHAGDHASGDREHGNFVTWPKERKAKTYRESDHQRRFVDWLRKRPDWKVTRVENEGKRSEAQTARAKQLGMTPGDTDLILIHKTVVWWWEMKDEGGRVSPTQRDIHAELRARKQNVVVAWDYEDAVAKAELIEEQRFGPDLSKPLREQKQHG